MANNNFTKYGSIKDVPQYINVASNLNLNIALCGAHGRGKTAIFGKYAEENGYELNTVILTRLVPEDMIGLPHTKKVNGEVVTAYSNPEWFINACKKKTLLFFDEFNNAEQDVQASILDLLESRSMGGMNLHDDTVIVLAFNPNSIAPNGKKLSKAMRDRLCVIPISDNKHKPYIDYFYENNITGASSVLLEMPEIVKDYDEDCLETAYHNAGFTYRSLEKADNIAKFVVDNNIDKNVGAIMCSGYGGNNGKVVFDRLYEHYSSQNSFDMIISEIGKVKDNEKEICKIIISSEHLRQINDFASIRSFLNRLEDELNNDEIFNNVINKCFTNEIAVLYKRKQVK